MEFIKRNSDYAFSALEFMSRFPQEKVFLINHITENIKVPEVFLRKIFQKLCKRGILISQRGPQGGFSFAKDPNQITAREIIESVQGPIFFNQCSDEKATCTRRKDCVLKTGMNEIQKNFMGLLENITLTELRQKKKRS